MLDRFGEDADILTVLKDGRPLASALTFYFRDTVMPYWGGGNAAGAEQQFKLAIANTGNRHLAAQMYADLGALAWKRHDIEAAKNSYLESLRLLPDQYRANLNLGLMFYERGDLPEAQRYIERSLAIFPTSPGYLALGRTLHSEGRDGEAAAAYRRALALTPDFSLAQQESKALTLPPGVR